MVELDGSLTGTRDRHGVEHLGLLSLRWWAEDVGVAIRWTLGSCFGGQGGDLVDNVLHLVGEARGGCKSRIGGMGTLEVALEVVDCLERLAFASRAGVLGPD